MLNTRPMNTGIFQWGEWPACGRMQNGVLWDHRTEACLKQLEVAQHCSEEWLLWHWRRAQYVVDIQPGIVRVNSIQAGEHNVQVQCCVQSLSGVYSNLATALGEEALGEETQHLPEKIVIYNTVFFNQQYNWNMSQASTSYNKLSIQLVTISTVSRVTNPLVICNTTYVCTCS